MDLDNLNAPQFVDFTQPLDYEEDNYFEFDHESGGVPVSIDDAFKESSDSFYDDAKENQEDFESVPPKKSIEKKSKIPKNLCTDIDAWRKGSKAQSPLSKPAVTRKSPRLAKTAPQISGDTQNSNKNQSETSDTSRSKRPLSSTSLNTSQKKQDISKAKSNETTKAKPALARHVAAVDAKRARTNSPADRSTQEKTTNRPLARSASFRASNHRRNDSNKDTEVSKLTRSNSFRRNHSRSDSKEVRVTRAQTPDAAKAAEASTGSATAASGAASKLRKTTTELELQTAEAFKKQLAQQRRKHEQYRIKAMHAPAVVAKHETKTLTRPEEFHFKTDDRLKNHGMETRQDRSLDSSRDFASSLRAHHPASPKPAIQRTKVQAFSFDRKRKRATDEGSESGGEFRSMAELVRDFNRTPDRFRKRANSREPSPSKRRRRSMSQPQLTLPKTPNLQTRTRSRPPTAKSYEQQQVEELEEHHKQQFKAHPVNEKIFEKSQIGVKKPTPRALTQPVTPQLELRRRAATWKERGLDDDAEQSHEFHANPVPKAILEGPTGVKPAKQLPLTTPASPAFALRNRVASIVKDDSHNESSEEQRSLRSRPAPKFGVPFRPKLDSRVTEQKPFSFDERMRTEQQRKEEKLQRLAEEQTRTKEFHANPIPDLSPDLPAKQVKPATRPKPFHLEIDARGQARAEEWSAKIKEELKHVREQANFKAKPSTVLSKEPFLPKKSNKPLTDVSEVQLNTEKRLEERAQFEKWRTERELEQHELETQRERLREEEERERERTLRKQLVPRAQPIRKYKEVAIRASDKPLTQPSSPAFTDRAGLRRSMRC